MKKILFAVIISIGFQAFSQEVADSISLRSPHYAENSVLSNGEIFKLEITESGIFKITYDYIKNLGVNPENIDPSMIQIYNNGEGRLKQIIEEDYIDDLVEIPYFASGLDDGRFDQNDFILFYAGGPDKRSFSPFRQQWEYDKNIYSFTNYCFIRFGVDKAKKINNVNLSGTPEYISNKTDVFAVDEYDNLNLLAAYERTSGSGQDWYGERVSNNSERDFSESFSNFIFDTSDSINVRLVFAGRNRTNATLRAKIGNREFPENISSVVIDNDEAIYARKIDRNWTFSPDNDKLQIRLQYAGEAGWVDKIEVNGRKEANYNNIFTYFSDKKAPANQLVALRIADPGQNFQIWDISDMRNISSYQYRIEGNTAVFNYMNYDNPRFVAFATDRQFPTPGEHHKVANQNLHAIDDAEMLIVYHADFEQAANDLARHRESVSGMKVYAIDQELIFNEFACGKRDPTAIRDFVRMLKIKNNNFGYLLLFGDGSYDQRGIITDQDNYVVFWETPGSLDPINSYPTDDYFGLISMGHGLTLSGNLNVAIGRFPVRTAQQAATAVQKLIDYEINPDFYGDWINTITFLADDEDASWDSVHFFSSENISSYLNNVYPVFNIDKIYMDAYTQVQTAGGQRYPEVNAEINNSFFKGMFMFIYFGHGGPSGLAQERVLTLQDIASWNNRTKLPLFITATCSFMGFDDPTVVTAGEETFLKDRGGVISLISTVRAVYSGPNDALIRAFVEYVFEDEENRFQPVGEILRLAKNKLSGDINNKRKFLLFGDPSMRFKFPSYDVKTTMVNGIETKDGIVTDTLGAMGKVSLAGYIADKSGNTAYDFNGKIYVTVFDKAQNLKTRANDRNFQPEDQREFQVQNKILFRGLAEVKNGEFDLSFIMPKDINYQYGPGKISYYAIDGQLNQAAGNYSGIIIGGTASDIISDNTGPEIELFMNDVSFIPGGMTNSEPVLLGVLQDDSGINITGLSIGHDLTARLNHDNKKIVLNNFFQSEMNDYKKGSFRYPLSGLDPGKYTVTVEAWDVFNNKSERSLDFLVIDENNTELRNVFNYPNPFTSRTSFMFEHDIPDSSLDILIQIFSMSGKLVKTIEHSTYSPGFNIAGIEWDGNDDWGARLGNGVYVYKIKVFSPEYNIQRESKFAKLVIIR